MTFTYRYNCTLCKAPFKTNYPRTGANVLVCPDCKKKKKYKKVEKVNTKQIKQKKKWDYDQYRELLETKFKLEDDNVKAYRQIRDLKSLRQANAFKIMKLENDIRKQMGFGIIKKEELK